MFFFNYSYKWTFLTLLLELIYSASLDNVLHWFQYYIVWYYYTKIVWFSFSVFHLVSQFFQTGAVIVFNQRVNTHKVICITGFLSSEQQWHICYTKMYNVNHVMFSR